MDDQQQCGDDNLFRFLECPCLDAEAGHWQTETYFCEDVLDAESSEAEILQDAVRINTHEFVISIRSL